MMLSYLVDSYDPTMGRAPQLTTDPDAVRREHLAAYKRLMFTLKRHRSELSDDGKRLFHHVAFSLYVDAHTIDSITPIRAVLDLSRSPSEQSGPTAQ